MTKYVIEHKNIIHAIKSRDGNKTMAEVQAHIERSKKDFLKNRKNK
jgi:DNA-binding GntR family transcriptional regulator